jgi:hypothetical protein
VRSPGALLGQLWNVVCFVLLGEQADRPYSSVLQFDRGQGAARICPFEAQDFKQRWLQIGFLAVTVQQHSDRNG